MVGVMYRDDGWTEGPGAQRLSIIVAIMVPDHSAGSSDPVRPFGLDLSPI
jgi:hypothetical protein